MSDGDGSGASGRRPVSCAERDPNQLGAWTSGRLSTDQVTILLDQATAVPDDFAEADDRLCHYLEDPDTPTVGGEKPMST